MNYPKFFNKWWLMLTYGVLLIFLSYFVFSISGKELSSAGIISGFISLLTGAVSINGYFFAGNPEKHTMELIAGVFSCIIGLFFLNTILISPILFNWLFAVYITINMLILLDNASNFETEINCRWLTVVLFIYTLVVCYLIVTGLSLFNLPISLFTGIQFILNGLLMIVMAFVLRKVEFDYNKTIQQIREE